MKVVSVIAKILTALATVAGGIYLLATYGDKIVEWCKNLIASLPKCEPEADVDVEEIVEEAAEAVEEAVEEAAEVIEEVAEEVVEAAEDVVADEADFEG